MAVWDNRPLSWGERLTLANALRREAAEKISEAQRIEAGLQADRIEILTVLRYEAPQAPVAAKIVLVPETASADMDI